MTQNIILALVMAGKCKANANASLPSFFLKVHLQILFLKILSNFSSKKNIK